MLKGWKSFVAGLSLLSCSAVANAQPVVETAYIRGASAPWGVSTNETAMDQVFGAGNWADLRMSGGAAPFMPGSGYKFIFLEGGDDTANELNAYLAANRVQIEAFVNAGGHLLLNSAPNQGGNIDFGFGGTTLMYPGFTNSVVAADPAHPVFAGPGMPVGTSFTGSAFGHAVIGAQIAQIIVGAPGDGNAGQTVLGAKRWGQGCVMFGGMTTHNFHDPRPNADNLRANILRYGADGCPGLAGANTLPQNLACARDLITQLQNNEVLGPAQRNIMLALLGTTTTYYNTVYRSLALTSLNSLILRTDGCPLRMAPDTIFNQGATGMDFVTSCQRQVPIYQCLNDARGQLMQPNGMN